MPSALPHPPVLPGQIRTAGGRGEEEEEEEVDGDRAALPSALTFPSPKPVQTLQWDWGMANFNPDLEN